MQQIEHTTYSGERPLFGLTDASLNDVHIGDGESGLKQVRRLNIDNCHFQGQYILWETEQIDCHNSIFAPASRASLWYGKQLSLSSCHIHSPKSLREIDGLHITDCTFHKGAETFWQCKNGCLNNIKLKAANYCFLHAENILIHNLQLHGKYAFQYCRNIEIHNATLRTKDAFWESDNCTIYDSVLRGEYLGWYSRNLRLVRCHIIGTQPLCYCRNLVLEDCTLAPACDRAFEFSDVHGNLLSGKPDMTPPYDINELIYNKL